MKDITYVYDHVTGDFVTWLFDDEIKDDEIRRHTGSYVPYNGNIYTKKNNGANKFERHPGVSVFKACYRMDYFTGTIKERYPDIKSAAIANGMNRTHTRRVITKRGGDFRNASVKVVLANEAI